MPGGLLNPQLEPAPWAETLAPPVSHQAQAAFPPTC